MTTTAPTDRQQGLRDRVAQVEGDLAHAESSLTAAMDAAGKAQSKLDAQRRALAQAEQQHAAAVGQLEAATSERDRVRGDLATLRRRLEMADLVRGSRS